MQKALIGVFDEYGQAEAAVRDLEIAGIMGKEVEIISDVDRDVRTEELGIKSRESVSEHIGRIFRGFHNSSATDVHDDPGEMPSYIGEQEFYASHVRDEGAVLIVRVPNDTVANVAGAILQQHGSKQRDGKKGVSTREVSGQMGKGVAGA